MILQTSRTNKQILIDDEDYHILDKKDRSYTVTSHGYASAIDYVGRVDGKYVYKRHYLHRLIMKAPKHLQVDHINGDRLDNRKENLRLCMGKSNARNKPAFSGKYKGVHYSKQSKKWVAQITKDYKVKHLGLFNTEDEAALAYNHAAKQLHGKYAMFNLLPQFK